ncbi:MAG: hypothetical protein JWQ87_2073 [Candidatus Sulfotelmatobacter sp.]|nr:hypothetical protein [Candidatus Sulfotelmatobacter sp.]
MPLQGRQAKYQLRGTGCIAGVRSDFTMKEVEDRVQRKKFIVRIGGDARFD